MCYEIKIEDIKELFQYFRENMYKAKEYSRGTLEYETMNRCVQLIKLDYRVTEINNTAGELSSHYPNRILIPEHELESYSNPFLQHQQQQQQYQQHPPPQQQETIYENVHDVNKLRNLIYKARYARSRARYPIPVILYKGKYICRSSTLSGGPEIYGRSGLEYFLGSDVKTDTEFEDEIDGIEVKENFLDESMLNEIPPPSPAAQQPPPSSSDEFNKRERSSDWHFIDTVRSQDIKLLKTFNIGTIVDLMVENKKVKFGMNVTSSEKVDKQKRYAKFTILVLPYPGCEFFQNYRQNSYSGRGIIYNWNQPFIDANIDVPNDLISMQLQIKWDQYRDWDLVALTQNYLKLLLKHVRDGDCGILVHCISGWDRTPLFISLLRICLWADGFIHQSLDPIQLLYLTVSYDWYLFGHNLPDRVNKGEDILHFCFSFLKYCLSDEFSILDHKHRNKYSCSSGSSCGGGGSSGGGHPRNDSESMLIDDLLMNIEIAGSNVSLNSDCSSTSNKSMQNNLSDTSINSTNGSSRSDFLIQNEDSNCSIEILSDHHMMTNSNNDIANSSLYNNKSDMGGHILTAATDNNNSNVFHPNRSSPLLKCDNGLMHKDLINNEFTNVSPIPRRTSPMSVPSARRYRTESASSSSSLSSWAVVSNTGSLRSSFKPNSTIQTGTNSVLLTTSTASTLTPTSPHTSNSIQNDEDSPASCNHDLCVIRTQRLRTIRALFYNSYSTTVGLKVVSGGSFFDNIKDTVGF